MNRKLRKPDGTPEMRSLDDMLKEAVDDETLRNLPGVGKPLNLKDYFSVGAESRMANKILKDNQVLPQHLQERKDAEDQQRQAFALIEQAKSELSALKADIDAEAHAITTPFPNRETCLSCLGWNQWPSNWADPTGTETPYLFHREAAAQFAKRMMQYNARVRNLVCRYMTHLQKAQENIQACRKRQMLSRTLSPTYEHTPDIDLEAKARDIAESFPYYPEMPADLNTRLKKWHKRQRPAFWKRFTTS